MIMNCATIIIPTLNRAIHLKRCLDSLAKNGWAKYSPILISVDYPPSDKYEQGYGEVISMLKTYDFSYFKTAKVFYQERNLGPSQNFEFLVEHSNGKVILTEDDNEFSPNFLEYINKGLDLFKDDDNVIAICGCKDTHWCHDNDENVVKIKFYTPYGLGIWAEKWKKLNLEIPEHLLSPQTWTLNNFWRLLIHNQTLFSMYVLGILCSNTGFFWGDNGRLMVYDSTISIFMHLTDKVCIAPIISKSRTWGNDGSGVNMKASPDNGKKIIDTNDTFSYHYDGKLDFDSNNFKKGNQYLGGSILNKSTLHALGVLAVFYILGKNRERVIRFLSH